MLSDGPSASESNSQGMDLGDFCEPANASADHLEGTTPNARTREGKIAQKPDMDLGDFGSPGSACSLELGAFSPSPQVRKVQQLLASPAPNLRSPDPNAVCIDGEASVLAQIMLEVEEEWDNEEANTSL